MVMEDDSLSYTKILVKWVPEEVYVPNLLMMTIFCFIARMLAESWIDPMFVKLYGTG